VGNILEKDALMKKLQKVHVLGIRSKTKLTPEILKAAKKLLCVGCYCIGTDQVDLPCAQSLGIPVFNSPFANTRSVAELVLAQSIILARKAGDQNRWMHEGKWTKMDTGCYEVRGKTMGIVGYGHVGSQLSVLAEALGFRVIYYDIVPKLPLGNAQPRETLQEVLKSADFVTLHVPYTKETHNMIGAEQIKMMKKGSYLMNAARGKCVDIVAAAEALKAGHLGGAYFDVYPEEPTDATLPLVNCPNTILSPHIGGSTQEAQHAIGVEVTDKITRFIEEGRTIGAANFPEVSLPPNAKAHRILHVHQNVPGVLRKINEIISDYNVSAQILKTTGNVGYLLLEVDAVKELSRDIKEKIGALPETIRSRVVYSPGFI